MLNVAKNTEVGGGGLGLIAEQKPPTSIYIYIYLHMYIYIYNYIYMRYGQNKRRLL